MGAGRGEGGGEESKVREENAWSEMMRMGTVMDGAIKECRNISTRKKKN